MGGRASPSDQAPALASRARLEGPVVSKGFPFIRRLLRGGDLPIPFIGTISGALPERGTQAEATMSESTVTGALGMTRYQAVELHMRSFPGWQPLDAPQAVLPTALEMPEEAALAARRIDALIVGVLTIGLAVVVATMPVALVSWLAPTGGSSTAPRTKRSIEEDARLLLAEAGGGEVAQEQKDEEEFEMQLGPLKTVVFAVRVLTSWSKADNLMLGGAGLAWEIIWLWLVARGPVPTTSRRDVLSLSEFQVVLATDVVGYFFRAVQAAWMKRQISLTDPAISIVMSAPASVFPVLGPRVDLLKVLVRNDKERGKCTLPHLRDLAAEFWPALVARLRVKKESAEVSPPQAEKSLYEKAKRFVAPKLVAQCVDSRYCLELGATSHPSVDKVECAHVYTDVTQILALVAMVVFEQYSGMLLVNLVISGGKIAAVFSLREFIWPAKRALPRGPGDVCRLCEPPAKERLCPEHGTGDLDVTEGTKAQQGVRALIDVAKRGWADHVAALVSAGIDKAVGRPRSLRPESRGYTPLNWAAGNGHADYVELLLKAGADKERARRYTPLNLAAFWGRPDCVELLLKAGADKDVQENYGHGPGPQQGSCYTPLNWAAGNGHADYVELLLKAGADKERARRYTPLNLAAFWGRPDCVELLLKAGADKDVQENYGHGPGPQQGSCYTPLHFAAHSGSPECVDLLLNWGADKDLQDENGPGPQQAKQRWTGPKNGWIGQEQDITILKDVRLAFHSWRRPAAPRNAEVAGLPGSLALQSNCGREAPDPTAFSNAAEAFQGSEIWEFQKRRCGAGLAAWALFAALGKSLSVLRRPVPQRNVAPNAAIAPVPGGLWGVSERHFLCARALPRE
ncbi:Ankyrin repeat, PH and SEC7 domain containing protein secG [Symbiodinium microadriaticum]|uniref:Ankyrin repeat, PH and SEC7 domain containing protein secG n=1 Tax=Symbiodinium microadriaticum TaxID=2951 RepID=A0A1Q9F1S7_SYMMI|nr:Ankyrin repeat, PH and SEC7 domain containing protein secG [Symbiodinium microadriaticum]